MRAVVRTRYGTPDVLALADVEKPVPQAGEVLIRVRAASVTSGDCRIRGFADIPWAFWLPSRLMFGLFKPKRRVLGCEVAGEIEAVGEGVTRFECGQAVMAYLGMKFGGYAEHVCVSQDGVMARKPACLTFEEAATVSFGALTALHFLRKAHIQASHKVLIVGASGAVGTAAVQLAKYYGAEVTGVCSATHVDLVRSLGADHVVDYTQTDVTQLQIQYDIIFDTVGKTKFASCRHILTPEGQYLMTVFGGVQLLQMLWAACVGRQKILCDVSIERAEDLAFILSLVESGHLRSVVDRSFPLEQAAQAHAYVETGHKAGNVVLMV